MKRSNKRTIAIIMIVLGSILFPIVGILWIDAFNPSQSAVLDKNLRKLLVTIARLRTSINRCEVLFKQKNVSITEIKRYGNLTQIATGDQE